MKKLLTITLILTMALLVSAGCALAPTASAEAATAADVDTSVSNRDASGEYDASEAVTLSPDGDLTIRSAGVYILSGDYECMIVIEAGEEDKVQLVLENASITN